MIQKYRSGVSTPSFLSARPRPLLALRRGSPGQFTAVVGAKQDAF